MCPLFFPFTAYILMYSLNAYCRKLDVAAECFGGDDVFNCCLT